MHRPTPESEVVQVPLHLWNSVCHCFYGAGPRYTEIMAARQQRAPEPEDGGPETENPMPTTIQEQLPSAWKPRGHAVPPAPKPAVGGPEESKK